MKYCLVYICIMDFFFFNFIIWFIFVQSFQNGSSWATIRLVKFKIRKMSIWKSHAVIKFETL